MLTPGNCLIFHKYKDLRDMMENMDKYQGARISRSWFVTCERTINEKGVVYVIVQDGGFAYSRHRPFHAKKYIEVEPRKNNKRW